MTYNDKLQAASFELKKSNDSLMKKNYHYYQGGDLKYVQDEPQSPYENFFRYDHAGRMTEARSSVEARGGTETNLKALPFRQTMTYNAFGNMTQLNTTRWTDEFAESYTYVNNRRQYPLGNPYDADGRDLDLGDYDAAGRIYYKAEYHAQFSRYYDGDGREGKRGVQRWDYAANAWGATNTAYYIRSTVLGGALISEADATGKKEQTYVLAAGTILARQKIVAVNNQPTEKVAWEHRDAADTQVVYTDSSGTLIFSPATGLQSSHYDAFGRMTGSPLTVRPPESQTNAPQRVPSPRFEDSLSLYRSTNECQMQVDGILQNCASVSSESLAVEGRNGDKVEKRKLKHELPGRAPSNIRAISDDLRLWLDPEGGDGWDTSYTGDDFFTLIKSLLKQVTCDRRLSRIFGDEDAFMATLYEPDALRVDGTRRNPIFRVGNESPTEGAAHLFVNRDGVGPKEKENNAFTPPGYSYTEQYTTWNGGKESGEFQNARRFYYKPGSLSKYGYKGGLVVNFTHIGPTDRNGNHLLNKGAPNNVGSTLVGNLGGLGSVNDISKNGVGGVSPGNTYNHSHMVFTAWDGAIDRKTRKPIWNTKNKIDPRKVFCGDLGF